jgi:hypothetical protein
MKISKLPRPLSYQAMCARWSTTEGTIFLSPEEYAEVRTKFYTSDTPPDATLCFFRNIFKQADNADG